MWSTQTMKLLFLWPSSSSSLSTQGCSCCRQVTGGTYVVLCHPGVKHWLNLTLIFFYQFFLFYWFYLLPFVSMYVRRCWSPVEWRHSKFMIMMMMMMMIHKIYRMRYNSYVINVHSFNNSTLHNMQLCLLKQGVTLTGHNTTGPPGSHGAIIRLDAAWHHHLDCAGEATCRPAMESCSRQTTTTDTSDRY